MSKTLVNILNLDFNEIIFHEQGVTSCYVHMFGLYVLYFLIKQSHFVS